MGGHWIKVSQCKPQQASAHYIFFEVILKLHRTKINITDKILLYGDSEKTFQVILLRKQTYSHWRRFLMKTINVQQTVS